MREIGIDLSGTRNRSSSRSTCWAARGAVSSPWVAPRGLPGHSALARPRRLVDRGPEGQAFRTRAEPSATRFATASSNSSTRMVGAEISRRPEKLVQFDMAGHAIRAARLDDLEALTDIYNHYVVHSAITFDLQSFTTAERRAWFDDHADSGPHRLLVATDGQGRCVGVRQQQPMASEAGLRHDGRSQRLLSSGRSWTRAWNRALPGPLYRARGGGCPYGRRRRQPAQCRIPCAAREVRVSTGRRLPRGRPEVRTSSGTSPGSSVHSGSNPKDRVGGSARLHTGTRLARSFRSRRHSGTRPFRPTVASSRPLLGCGRRSSSFSCPRNRTEYHGISRCVLSRSTVRPGIRSNRMFERHFVAYGVRIGLRVDVGRCSTPRTGPARGPAVRLARG